MARISVRCLGIILLVIASGKIIWWVSTTDHDQAIAIKFHSDTRKASGHLGVRKIPGPNKLNKERMPSSSFTQYNNSLTPDFLIQQNESWKEREAQRLSDIIQNRLHHLQNPANCTSARKLVCELSKTNCAFGSQMHALAHCFMTAYRSERTFIVISRDWAYSKNGFTGFFKPLSDTCLDTSGASQINWKSLDTDTKVVYLGNAQNVYQIAHLLNTTPIPLDLAPRILRLHGNPTSWWMGQFFKYILRLRPEVQTLIDHSGFQIGYKHPVVGVQVRRTDKFLEAQLFPIEKYMKNVKQHFDTLESRQVIDKRRVYLATDDLNVLHQARTKYPKYEFIGFHNNTITAQLKRRFSEASLMGIIQDLFFLSHADYLVCTFSSNVGRLAYEMMQTYRADASNLSYSLDNSYYVHGQHSKLETLKMPTYSWADKLMNSTSAIL